MKTRLLPLFVSILALAILSCGSYVDDIFERDITISPGFAPEGIVGQFYSHVFTAAIDNEPNDDDFDYHFDFVTGLPPGLFYTVGSRTLHIDGTPTTAGVYTLTFEVHSPDLDDELVFHNDDQPSRERFSFQITILESE